MRRHLWMVLWPILLVGPGCIHSYYLTPGASDGALRKMEQLARNHKATVQLQTGETFSTPLLQLQSDSLVTARGTYALSEVKMIYFHRRMEGMKRGVIIGAAIGTSIGNAMMLYSLLVADNGEGIGAVMLTVMLISTGLYIMPLSAGLGAFFGFLSGVADVFYVVPAQETRPPSSRTSSQQHDPGPPKHHLP